MEGWIKMYRELLTKPIWLKSTPEQKSILVALLLMANHKENQWEWQGQKFMVKSGQFVTSLSSIVKSCGDGVSIQNVRTALTRFKKLDFLTYESTKTGRLITINNWGIYQGGEDSPNIETNKDLTKTQQRPNKDLTTNKNDNNDNNEKRKEGNKLIDVTWKNLLNFINESFGRLLSSKDMKKISELYKEFGAELIKESIKEAINEHDIKNISYSEKILLTWKDKDITNLKELEEYKENQKKGEYNNGRIRENNGSSKGTGNKSEEDFVALKFKRHTEALDESKCDFDIL